MSVNGGTWNAVGGNQYNYNVHTATFSQNFGRALSTPSSPPLSSAEVYARQLLLTGNGYPLWVPEPLSNCSVYRSKGVRIGDVGYVDRDSGAFAPMFNIRAQPDDRINRLGVPEGFKTVEFDPNDIVPIPEYHRPKCAVTSKPQIIDGLKPPRNLNALPETDPDATEYMWNTPDGAILHLPSGATRLNAGPGIWREYALKHAINWHKSTQTKGWNLPNDSLYLITGIDKTHSWGVGAFSGAQPIDGIGVSVRLRTVMEGGIPFSRFISMSHPIDFRVGPPSKSLVFQENDLDPSSTAQDNSIFPCDAPSGQNQCIFVCGWRIKVQKNILSWLTGCSSSITPISDPPFSLYVVKQRKNIKKDATGKRKPSKAPKPHAVNLDTEAFTVQNVAEQFDFYHPADIINSFLLNHFPTAQKAITHDDDWCSLVRPDDQVFPDENELIARLIANFDLKMDPASGGAYIELKKSPLPLSEDRRVDSWVGPSGSASSAAFWAAVLDSLEYLGLISGLIKVCRVVIKAYTTMRR